jgi:nitrate/nitrite-specific signal transduction histidine kinase
MQESLWNMNAESAHSLVESVMRDRSVLQVQVVGQADTQFMHVRSPRVASGNVYRAEREILVRGERIGRIMVEMDDARSQQELREKLSYVFVLAAQLMVSLLLIVLFLNSRLIKPLRKLMRFSDRLSHGDFETRSMSPAAMNWAAWRSSWSRCGWRSSACSRTSASARNVSAPS